MGIDKVNGRLLPFLRIGNRIIEVAAIYLSNIATGPKVHLVGRSRLPMPFVFGDFRYLALGNVRSYGFQQSLDGPAIIGGQKDVLHMGRGTHDHFVFKILCYHSQ